MVRLKATVAKTASPSDPPICRAVLRTPEARPACAWPTSEVAAAAKGLKSMPRAKAIKTAGGKTVVQYDPS